MAVTALEPGYVGVVRDRVENFNGKQLLFVGWEDHLMFASPIALLVDGDMTFADLVNGEFQKSTFIQHPDWQRIDWDAVKWYRSDEEFSPASNSSLKENKLGHKAMLRFKTPGLNGVANSFN